MQEEKSRFVRFIQVLAFLAACLVSVVCPLTAAADWASLVKDELYREYPRTLEGKAFLEYPISGATVKIYDRSGFLLYSVDSITGEDGSFSITRPLPESFTVVIGEGQMAGELFDHELARYIPLFDETKHYKVNAVTTLLEAYLDDHPGISYVDAKEAIKAYLCIPESIDLDEIIYSSEWYCYYFSHYSFMKEANAVEGMTFFIDQLLDELEAGETKSFYDAYSIGSSMFKNAMDSLLEGALSELGGEGAGWILGLLNIGGDDIDGRLSEMKTDLQEILNDLEQIINALTALAQELAMDTNEVETYIQGRSAQDAISTIKTHYGPDEKDSRGDTNTLKYFSFLTSKDSNPTTKAQMATLVENINGSWDIEDKVQKIHDAIIPDIGNTDGLIDLWTKTFLLQGPVSSDQLMSYYQTLEQYFAVLLFYQFKGANIVVEALNYQSASGAALPLAVGLGEDGETPASSYLKGTFQPMIQEETDRFLKNVVRLIINNCGLYWEKSFLPDNARDILARATFFVIQTLGEDHYGLRLGAFGTSNLVHDISEIGAVKQISPDTFQWVGTEGEKVDVDMESRPYDYWGTLKSPDLGKLQKGTTYTLLEGDLGAFDPGTDYTVKYSTGDGTYPILGTAAVKTYTKDYKEDPKGEISYGYFLSPFRVGGKELIMDPSAFKRNYYTNDRDGHVNWWHDENLDENGLYLYVHGKNKYTNDSSSIDMKVEWYHRFTFEGSESTTAYLNIEGKITGSVYIHHENYWSNEAEIGYHVGVYDDTHNSVVKRIDGSFKASDIDTKQGYNKTLNDQISFTLEPGVEYYVYADIWGHGENYSGDYEYICEMKDLTHLSLTFVDSEF
jgi:hypothetical protein